MKNIAVFFAILLLASPAVAAYLPTATIANGAAISGEIDLTPYTNRGSPTVVALIMPAAWTTADITLQGSADGCANFSNVFVQAGTEYKLTSPAAAEYIILTPNDLIGLNCLKVRSGTAGSPVNQGAARIMTVVVTRP